MQDLNTPKEIYKNIIDCLVKRSYPLSSKLILKDSIFSKSIEKVKYNDFVLNLKGDQKNLLAEMMHLERQSAIHDVLAELTWWIECKDVTICYKGKEMPDSLSDAGMHGDYMARLDDWEWPQKN